MTQSLHTNNRAVRQAEQNNGVVFCFMPEQPTIMRIFLESYYRPAAYLALPDVLGLP